MDERLVERVARAIYDVLEGSIADQDYGRQVRQWGQSKELARAAIQAVIDAGWKSPKEALEQNNRVDLVRAWEAGKVGYPGLD